MKKLVLFFAAAMFAVTFAACGNKAEKQNNDQEAVAPGVDQVQDAPGDDVVVPEGDGEVVE